MHSCMCVEDGDTSCLHHRVASTYDSSIVDMDVILRLIASHPKSGRRWNNIVAALESEHYNRICEIHIFYPTNSRFQRFSAAMQKPFPELTRLEVVRNGDVMPVLPDSFLGESAPRLRDLRLQGISFPSMPKLLLSANGLVTLDLWDIPDSGYFSPDALATALAVMTRLETLHLGLVLRFRPDTISRPRPPPTRFVLPAFTKLMFGGVYEYLEDLLARIDVPLLYDLNVIIPMDLNFDVPQLRRLISHAEEFKTFDHAEMSISDRSTGLRLYPKTRVFDHPRLLQLRIVGTEFDRQLSSLAQVCSSSFPLISALEELEIMEDDHILSSHWRDDMVDTQWLELLGPFTALKSLYLSGEIARRVCGALQELSGERATEVLPALRNIFVDGFRSFEHTQEAIRPFVAARQLFGHPVAIDHWRRRSVFEGR